MRTDNKNLDYRGKPRVQTSDFGESLTVQSDNERADIRKILQRYEAVGIVDHLNQVDAMYRDVTEFTDLHDALMQAKEAETQFMKLPSKLREVFDHDVAKWLDAAHDPEKIEQLYRPKLEKLGILEPVSVEALPEAEPIPPGGDVTEV